MNRAGPMTAQRCPHCHQLVPPGGRSAPFCCAGCAAVYELLHDEGLERFYDLAGERPAPSAPEPAPHGLGWLDPLVESAEDGRAPGQLCTLELDVQGIHCAACVWLMEETFRRHAGAALTVNPALGKTRLTWRRGRLDPRAWIRAVEAFGYRFGPARKRATRSSIELPLRLGVSAALTANVMLFSISFYFGLAPSDGALFTLFGWLSLALSTAVVAIGGWPFFRAAWAGLKRGVLHLDLPIAAGILLVYATSLLRMRAARGDLAYFDSLDVFITLMLAGRFLQERVIERNRRYLLEDDGAEGWTARRVEGERLVTIPASRIVTGDRLLVAPGELVPVDARLVEPAAEISSDWISGESEPRALAADDFVDAGSFNAGSAAFHVVATQDFAASPLVRLLRLPARGDSKVAPHRRTWDRLARFWVAGVGAFALLAIALWLPAGFDRALAVAAALLVVTCPCALGIAIPLAYELAHVRLRRRGLYVRADDLLDRLAAVRKIVFDKTGTLTLGWLELAEPAALERLEARERDILFNLAVRSAHPASRATARQLETRGARYQATATILEVPGRGVEWRRPDGLWRLGHPGWATHDSAARRSGTTLLGRDGEPVLELPTREVPRPDAARELAALASRGYEIWLLSGDEPGRAASLADRIGLSPDRAIGGLDPAAKAAWMERLDRRDTLYLGDGVNDALAFTRALAAGTPAIDRPVMPGRSDFFLVGEGLAPLADAFTAALQLRRAVRRLLGFAVTYNLLAVGAALAGWVTPLAAAVAMPASTVALVLLTVAGLAERRPAARAEAASTLLEAHP